MPVSPVSVLDRAALAHAGWLARIDPRAKIAAAVGFTLVVAMAGRLATLGVALAAAGLVAALAQLPVRAVARRLAALNMFMVLVLLIVPWTTHGSRLAVLGPVEVTEEGVRLAVSVVLKGNAIVLGLQCLLGTLDLVVLGHALRHLYVPEKLVHLLLFTVRYIAVLEREYRRLTAAMKVRGFRPGMNRHTYRTYGYLVGMLLVRSLDRAERIVAAMKCRGFRGHFYLLDHFAFGRRDAWFVVVGFSILLGLGLVEWI